MATKVQKALDLCEVPAEKWTKKIQRTLLGLATMGFGVAGIKLWGFPWWASTLILVFGATMWAGDVVTGTLKALLDPFKAYRRAWNDDGKEDAP